MARRNAKPAQEAAPALPSEQVAEPALVEESVGPIAEAPATSEIPEISITLDEAQVVVEEMLRVALSDREAMSLPPVDADDRRRQ